MSTHKASDKEKEVLEKYLIQFLNIEKRFPLLPGIGDEASVAGLFGLEPADLNELRNRFRDNAREAAVELLKDDNVSEQVENLPFQPGDTIAAIGDSMTDDLQGWFAIFSDLLGISLPDHEYTFINSGVSYNTSTDALRRLHQDVLSKEPDWVIIALGTFDALRLDIAPDRTLIPLAETWENLNMIKSAVSQVTDNPVIWMTPPPVIPAMIDDLELFDYTIMESDLEQIREIITGKIGYIVDPLGYRMGNPVEAWYYLSDGLHPSLSGHLNTVAELLKALTQQEPDED